MSGIRFEQEFRDKSKCKSAGTVVGAFVCNGAFWSIDEVCYEVISRLFDHPKPVVRGGAVSFDLLRKKCECTSEAMARTIHLALFERLDKNKV